jgi:hypothetical protein
LRALRDASPELAALSVSAVRAQLLSEGFVLGPYVPAFARQMTDRLAQTGLNCHFKFDDEP